MGLVLHELATNSVKYGTLGKDDGTISVKWSFRRGLDGSRVFWFDWDDPLSTRELAAKGNGFGSKLISSLIETKWNGVMMVVNASHFRITFEIPLAE
jgi:two-component sensor histidine kinase